MRIAVRVKLLRKIAACCLGAALLASCASHDFPDQVDIHISAAELFFSSNDRARGADALSAVAMQHPYSGTLRLKIAGIFLKYNDHQAARTYYEQAMKLGETLGATLGLGRIELHGNNIEQADIYFRQVLTTYPTNADAINGLGVTFDLRNDFQQAQALYKQALDEAPSHLGARNNLALSMALNGEAYLAQAMQTQLYVSYSQDKTVRHTLSLIQAANADEIQSKKVVAIDMSEEHAIHNIGVMRHFQTAQSQSSQNQLNQNQLDQNQSSQSIVLK